VDTFTNTGCSALELCFGYGKFTQSLQQFPIPARMEQVHTVEVAQRLGHVTFFKTNGDDKDFIAGDEVCFFKRNLEFFMTIALLLVKAL
jgi:hypothetical protein